MPRKRTVRAIERAVLQIVRGLGRRHLGRATELSLEGLVNFSHLAVVDCLSEEVHGTTETTIGMIARRLNVDPSRASRMVMGTLKAGYIERIVSQGDARQTFVKLTDKGKKVALRIEHMRLKHFAAMLRGWTEEECAAFAQLLVRFAHGDRKLRMDRKKKRATPTPLRDEPRSPSTLRMRLLARAQ